MERAGRGEDKKGSSGLATTQNKVMGASKSVSWPFYATLAILTTLAAFYFFHTGFQAEVQKGFEAFSNDVEGDETDWVNSFGYWAPVIVILGFLVQMFLIFIPSILLILVSIMAFAGWKGVFLALAGVFVASTVGFLMGRFLGEKTLDSLVDEEQKKKIDFYVDRYGIWAIIASRFNPFLSMDALSFVAGIMRMGYWKFIGGTLLGITPLILLLKYFGRNQDQFMSSLLWFSIFSVVCLLVFIIVDHRIRKRRKKSN